MGRLIGLVLVTMALGCGSVKGHVDGKIDTSGTLTVKVDASQVIAFFQYECETFFNLQPGTPEYSACVTQHNVDWSNFLAK